MENILLTGFYGEGNLGDEAILRAICQNLPQKLIPIITTGSKQPFGISIPRRGIFSWLKFLKAASKSPVTLFSGGILQDWSWEGVTFFAHRIIAAAKMGSTPILFGAGIGPLRNEKAKKLVKKALSYVEIAYVRDFASYALYKELSPDSEVKLGTDCTWYFPITIKKNNEKSKSLAVNLRQWGDKQLLEEAYKEITDFNGYKEGFANRQSDIKEISILKDNVSKSFYYKDFLGFVEKCKNHSHGIAMRYHAALAMLRAGLATKLICYDDKVKDLADSIGVAVDKIGVSSEFQLASKDFLSKNEKLFKEMKEDFIVKLSEHYSPFIFN